MEKYRTRTSEFYIDDKDIISKDIIEGVNVTAADIDEDQQVLVRLSKGKKAFLIIKASAFHTMTPEAIERLKPYILKSRHATAMVSVNLGVRIFVDTVAAMLKDKHIYRMFSSEDEARKWLLNIRKEIQQKKSDTCAKRGYVKLGKSPVKSRI